MGVAATGIGDELFTNPGFETVTNGGAANFGTHGGWGGDYISLETTPANVHSGNYAVKFVTTNGGNPYIMQSVNNLPGDGYEYKYKLSFWYKGTVKDAANGFTVKVEQYGSKGYIGDKWLKHNFSARKWTYIEYEFTLDPNVTRVMIYPRLMASEATVFIDDLSFMISSGPEQFKLDTDWVFYYEDYSEATATLTMDNFYEDDDYKIDFTIEKDGLVQASALGKTFVGNKAEAKLNIMGLQKKTEYELRATVRSADGTVIDTKTQRIYRYDRPKALTSDGVYVKNGKTVNPVIVYHMGLEHCGQAGAGGINVIQYNALYNLDNMEKVIADLNYLHSVDMMAAMVCYFNMKPAGHEDNIQSVQKLVAAVKDHPAVFCYMIMDEPFSHYENAEEMMHTSYKIIRDIDDVHPVYVCEDQKDKYSVSAKYIDCLGIDPYPGDGDYGRHVANMTQAAVAGTKGKKPVYCILQAFTFKSTTPTAEQLRATTYQAYMAGAKGIGYYPWIPDIASDGYLNKGIYWDGVVSFEQKDKPIFDAYYAHGEMQRFNIYKDENLWYESFTDGECVYTAVLNQTGEDKTADISLVSTNGKISVASGDTTIVNGGELAAVTKGNNGFSVNLSPYQAVLYKTVPEESFNIADLDDIAVNGGFERMTDGVLDGWFLTAGAGMTAPTQAEALKADDSGNKYISLTGETARIEAVFTGHPGRTYILEFDYKTTEANAALVNAETVNPYRQEGVWLPSSGGKWETGKMVFTLKNSDKDDVIVRLRNMKGTSEVCYDNVSLTPIKTKGEILLLNPNGEEVTEISQINKDTTAYVENLEPGDRIYVAVYGESYGEERLIKACVTTSDGDEITSLALDEGYADGNRVKCFVWTRNMSIKLIKNIK